MCTLIKNGKIMSFQDLKERYGLGNEDFFRYLQLRDYLIKEIQCTTTSDGVLEVMIQTYNGSKFRAISELYQHLRGCKADSTMYIKERWEKKLNIDITTEEWLNMCQTQCTTTNSRTWREFGWKNITHYFITPKLKSKQTGTQQPCWRKCGERDKPCACFLGMP